MHVRVLNFVLWSEIFVNFDKQLQASHLILGCNLVYSTWQPFRQALSMGSPLLSYIDMRHPNFLSPNLTVGEARDFGPWLVREESLIPVRDTLANSISQSHVVHKPVEELKAQVQPTNQVAAESVNSSEVEANQGKDEIVVKRTMTIDCFLLDARSATQQQQTQSKNQTPLAAHSLKRQRTSDQPPRVSRDAPPKTPLA